MGETKREGRLATLIQAVTVFAARRNEEFPGQSANTVLQRLRGAGR